MITVKLLKVVEVAEVMVEVATVSKTSLPVL